MHARSRACIHDSRILSVADRRGGWEPPFDNCNTFNFLTRLVFKSLIDLGSENGLVHNIFGLHVQVFASGRGLVWAAILCTTS